MPASDYQPEVDAVGAILRTYTIEVGDETGVGDDVGTFTDETDPTGDEVEEYISIALGDVSVRLGAADIDDEDLLNAARALVVLRAAMYVLIGKKSEQVGDDESPYAALRELFNENLAALLEALSETADESGEGSVPGAGVGPSFAFPEDAGGLIGWGTPF